jgi:hypothetical protein
MWCLLSVLTRHVKYGRVTTDSQYGEETRGWPWRRRRSGLKLERTSSRSSLAMKRLALHAKLPRPRGETVTEMVRGPIGEAERMTLLARAAIEEDRKRQPSPAAEVPETEEGEES